jgi:oxygen-independent coproporphyrinogen-3 oxidase
MRRYLRGLDRELRLRQGLLARPLRTIYVGGGSPTFLDEDLLARLLEMLAPLSAQVREYTVETNPADLDRAKARRLAEAGVNRLSVGAQSFRGRDLAWLGRRHRAGQVERTMETAREAGITNLGLDLIYALGGQSMADWSATLDAAVRLAPKHISCYCLSVDPGTLLERQVEQGQVELPEESLQEEMYFRGRKLLLQAGYDQYELSNFCREGFESRHNLTYWANASYLGLGPAAASYTDGVRRSTCADLESYCLALKARREPACSCESLAGRAHLAETVMLQLRRTAGIDREAFAVRFGVDVVKAFEGVVCKHVKLGTIEVDSQRLRLSPGSYFVADAVMADFLADL